VDFLLLMTDFTSDCSVLPDLEMGLTAGVTGRQGMLTPSTHVIPPLVYPGVRVRHDPTSGISGGLC
jgi:hypothetical protein